MTAQENIKRLPQKCYGRLPEDNTVIHILAGESGYYKINVNPNPPSKKIEEIEKFINESNLEMKIDYATRLAMEHGSMFGWGTPVATPEHWREHFQKHPNKLPAGAVLELGK